jgi:tetratricopeptide (TPR) repeat protein
LAAIAVILLGAALAVAAFTFAPASPADKFRALQQDSASAFRWCDLGDQFFAAGQNDTAAYCMARAMELGPKIPPVWIRAANFYFERGDPQAALRASLRVLELVPNYDQVIFGYYDRLIPDTPAILTSLAPRPRALRAYFRHLLSSGQVESAGLAWRRLSPDDQLAIEYLDFLVRQRKPQSAEEAWAAYAGKRSPDYLHPNRLFNGSFELEPTKALFDWAIVPSEETPTTRDATLAKAGHWSLRIEFQGRTNVDYQHAAQTAYLAPGTYRFSAFVKTQELTTDEGIRFRIFGPGLEVVTDALTGTNDWTGVVKTFTVSRPASMVTVQVRRIPSLKFDNKIRGTVWVDAVSLTPVR